MKSWRTWRRVASCGENQRLSTDSPDRYDLRHAQGGRWKARAAKGAGRRLLGFEDLADAGDEVARAERFFEGGDATQFAQLVDERTAGVAGHEDDFEVWSQLAGAAGELEAADFGHHHVAEQHVDAFTGIEQRERFLGRAGG